MEGVLTEKAEREAEEDAPVIEVAGDDDQECLENMFYNHVHPGDADDDYMFAYVCTGMGIYRRRDGDGWHYSMGDEYETLRILYY
mmetsp:Transcript_49252/g.57563  ORF Transcript_49252/g.57563 Transcript_49252/m.57563 type:complete len:85 (+) Transcript_49252:625-879(+)